MEEIQNLETDGKVSKIEEIQKLETSGKVSKIEEIQDQGISGKVSDVCSGLSFSGVSAFLFSFII